MVTSLVPAVIGAPLRTPEEERPMPAGRTPEERLHTGVPDPPRAVNAKLYGAPTVPTGADAVVIERAETTAIALTPEVAAVFSASPA
jgi:hypothetical protein